MVNHYWLRSTHDEGLIPSGLPWISLQALVCSLSKAFRKVDSDAILEAGQLGTARRTAALTLTFTLELAPVLRAVPDAFSFVYWKFIRKLEIENSDRFARLPR